MKIQSTHDKFFKSTFGNLALAKDFLENYLPETILNQLDLENIELQKDSFITANLQESFSDLIFKTSFAEREGYLCLLFEHKSYLGADLVFQLLKYMANIWTSKIQKEKATVLPIILPIVIYHGAKPRNIKTSLGEMLPDFSGLAPEFKKHIPDFSYLLYNLPELTPTMLRGSPVLQVILKTMVIIFDQDTRKIVDVFLEAAEIWGRLPQSASNLNLFKSLTIYILYSRSDLTSDLLHTVYPRVEKTYPKGGELIVTLADRLKEEGRQEGHQEGRREGIENMIKNQILAGVNLDLIIKTSGLTEQEVLRLAQNLKDQEKNGQIII